MTIKKGHSFGSSACGKGPVKMARGGGLMGAGPSVRGAGIRMSSPRALTKSSSVKSAVGDRLRGAVKTAMKAGAAPDMPALAKGGTVSAGDGKFAKALGKNRDAYMEGRPLKKGGAVEPRLRK